uniref:Uncharacterized protein n=1 Tax=Setaria italica TaxID=4555 RepID=K3ZB57_SETIT
MRSEVALVYAKPTIAQDSICVGLMNTRRVQTDSSSIPGRSVGVVSTTTCMDAAYGQGKPIYKNICHREHIFAFTISSSFLHSNRPQHIFTRLIIPKS